MVLLSSQWYLATMDFERLRHIPCTCDWCALSFKSCRSSHWHLVAVVNMIPSNITKVSQPSMIIIDNLCIYIYMPNTNDQLTTFMESRFGAWVVAQGWVGPCSASNSCLANAVSSTTSICILFPWVRSTRVEARCDKYAATIGSSILTDLFCSWPPWLFTADGSADNLSNQCCDQQPGRKNANSWVDSLKRTGIRRAVPKHSQIGKMNQNESKWLINDVANCPEFSQQITASFNVRSSWAQNRIHMALHMSHAQQTYVYKCA